MATPEEEYDAALEEMIVAREAIQLARALATQAGLLKVAAKLTEAESAIEPVVTDARRR